MTAWRNEANGHSPQLSAQEPLNGVRPITDFIWSVDPEPEQERIEDEMRDLEDRRAVLADEQEEWDGLAEHERWTEAELAASARLMATLEERKKARADYEAAKEAQRLAFPGTAEATARAARHAAHDAMISAEAAVTRANARFRQEEILSRT
jgi:hypothetical protein